MKFAARVRAHSRFELNLATPIHSCTGSELALVLEAIQARAISDSVNRPWSAAGKRP